MPEFTDTLGPVVDLAVLVRKARLTRMPDLAALCEAYGELLIVAGRPNTEPTFAGPIGALGRLILTAATTLDPQTARARLLEHGAILMRAQHLLDTEAMDVSFIRSPKERGQA